MINWLPHKLRPGCAGNGFQDSVGRISGIVLPFEGDTNAGAGRMAPFDPETKDQAGDHALHSGFGLPQALP